MHYGMTVVGLVSGTHVLEDIKVAVPHQVAVQLTGEQVLNSKDLYRALGQGKLFKLSGGVVQANPGKGNTAASNARIAELEKENKELKRQLAEEQRRNAGLQQALEGLNKQLDGVLATMGRIESAATAGSAQAPRLDGNLEQLLVQFLTQAQAGGSPQLTTAAVAPSQVGEAVGGEAPIFISDQIRPEDAKSSINIAKEKQEGSSVTDAAGALKKLRKKQSEG